MKTISPPAGPIAFAVVLLAASCSQHDGMPTSSGEPVAVVRNALTPQTTWFPIGPLYAVPLLEGDVFEDSSPFSDSNDPNSSSSETGRATSVAAPPQRPFDVYLGTAGGGLWEAPTLLNETVPLSSTSATPSISPWSQIFAGPIGSFAIDTSTCNTAPCGTLWVGTGEAGMRRETFPGTGLYELVFSSGGGSTCNEGLGGCGQPGYVATLVPGSNAIVGGAIGNVVLAGTTSSQLVYLTVTGANVASGYDATVFSPPPTAGFGVFSYNQGQSGATITRENVPPNDPPTLNLPGGLTLAQNAGTTYVLAGIYNRGIYRKVAGSTNSWCPLNAGAPAVGGCPTPSTVLPNPSTTRFDYIDLASSGATVYATFADCSNVWSGNGAGANSFSCPINNIFVSQDGGSTWTSETPISIDGINTYSNYDHALAVSPLSPQGGPQEVYIGGFLVNVSVDGGKTFPNFLAGIHPDVHAIFPSPHKFTNGTLDDSNGTQHLVYVASDGALALNLFDPTTLGNLSTVNPTTGSSAGAGQRALIALPPSFSIDRLSVQPPCPAAQSPCTTALLAGTNDNGSIVYNGGRVWQTATGGDVSDIPYLDQSNAFVSWYGTQPTQISPGNFNPLSTAGGAIQIPFGAPATLTDDGTEFSKFATTGSPASGPDGHGKLMLPPFIRDIVSNKFYYGTDRVYQTDTNGSSLVPISPRLIDQGKSCTRTATGPAQGTCGPLQYCVQQSLGSGQFFCRKYYTDIEKIDAISALASRNDQVLVGMYSGAFWKLVGSSFVQVTGLQSQRPCSASDLNVALPAVPGMALGPTPLDPGALSNGARCAPITSIDVNPFQPNQAYVTIGGFLNPNQHVFLYTNNGPSGSGDTWTPMTDGSLPADVPASVIRADPSLAQHVYLGTQVGLFERTASAPWAQVSTVPSVPVYDVVFDTALQRAYAGTHGRGVYMTVTNPVVEAFAGWMDPIKCPAGQPCIWDIMIYGQGFQPSATPCTVNILTPGGNVCTGGTLDAFSKNPIMVNSSNGMLGQSVFNETDGKLTIAVCFNGNCVGPGGTTNISACEPTPSNTGQTIAAVQVLCPNNNPVVVPLNKDCPQLQSPPAATWDPKLASDPPPSNAPPITSVTLEAALDGMPMEALCSVTIPIFASDTHNQIVDRARAAFASSATCSAAGVQVVPKPPPEVPLVEDLGNSDTLVLRAPNAIGRALYIATIEDPSAAGAPGVCQHFGGFPGYATNQLDIMDTTFSTLPSGARGGSVTYTETSPLGICAITVPTNPGDNASTIAQNVLNAYEAAYPTDSNPTCPYSSNPGDLVATSPFVPLAPGTLNSIASTAIDICINDTGVGVSVGPNGVPLLAATLSQAALFATGNLLISDGVKVEEPSGGFALVANEGGTQTALSPDVSVGAIISVAPVTISDRVTVTGVVKSEGSITLGNQDVIAGPTISSSNIALPDLSAYIVSFPSQFATGLTLQPGATGTLAPGAYQATSVQSRATLKLSAGTYFFQSIDVEPQATVSLTDAAGTVVIYLQSSAILRGQFVSTRGGDPKLRIVYEGTGTIQLNAPFSGTAVAPNAELDVTPANGSTYRGSFFGQTVFADANSVIEHLPPN